MSSHNVKPAYGAKRRIQFLFALVLLLIIGCTVGWFFIAGQIDTISRNVIAQQANLGNNIDCSEQDVRGYPFRFGIFCSSVSFESARQGITFNAGALRSAAQFYAPRDVIVELDSPARFERIGFESWSLNWSQMRARILATEPLPQNLSISGQNVVLGAVQAPPIAKADGLEIFMRVVDQDVDLAGRIKALGFDDFAPELTTLPPLGGDFDVRVPGGGALLLAGQQSLRGVDVDLRRLALLLSDDRGIIASGPLSISLDGMLNGTLDVRIVDVDGVLGVFSAAMPDFAPLMTAFANGQQRSGEKGDEIEFQITIDNGQARMGLIPLGRIAPL